MRVLILSQQYLSYILTLPSAVPLLALPSSLRIPFSVSHPSLSSTFLDISPFMSTTFSQLLTLNKHYRSQLLTLPSTVPFLAPHASPSSAVVSFQNLPEQYPSQQSRSQQYPSYQYPSYQYPSQQYFDSSRLQEHSQLPLACALYIHMCSPCTHCGIRLFTRPQMNMFSLHDPEFSTNEHVFFTRPQMKMFSPVINPNVSFPHQGSSTERSSRAPPPLSVSHPIFLG